MRCYKRTENSLPFSGDSGGRCYLEVEVMYAPAGKGAVQGCKTICGDNMLQHAETETAINQQVDGCLLFQGVIPAVKRSKSHL